ncbi:hypothetical protein [Pasteuria penetrans]|uniref:hypothetical protein n=1 Tax=Pasteuria penetrans TaxID=86005 RepID=UPI000FA3744E|nr:hypothetical protein [Pasteuria penetrans]
MAQANGASEWRKRTERGRIEMDLLCRNRRVRIPTLGSRLGGKTYALAACGVRAGCVSRSRSRDEGCSALRNRLIGSRLQTA